MVTILLCFIFDSVINLAWYGLFLCLFALPFPVTISASTIHYFIFWNCDRDKRKKKKKEREKILDGGLFFFG